MNIINIQFSVCIDDVIVRGDDVDDVASEQPLALRPALRMDSMRCKKSGAKKRPLPLKKPKHFFALVPPLNRTAWCVPYHLCHLILSPLSPHSRSPSWCRVCRWRSLTQYPCLVPSRWADHRSDPTPTAHAQLNTRGTITRHRVPPAIHSCPTPSVSGCRYPQLKPSRTMRLICSSVTCATFCSTRPIECPDSSCVAMRFARPASSNR
jgi:hypothetical protein